MKALMILRAHYRVVVSNRPDLQRLERMSLPSPQHASITNEGTKVIWAWLLISLVLVGLAALPLWLQNAWMAWVCLSALLLVSGGSIFILLRQR